MTQPSVWCPVCLGRFTEHGYHGHWAQKHWTSEATVRPEPLRSFPTTGTPLDLEPALWLRDRWVYTQASALHAVAEARAAAIEETLAIAEAHGAQMSVQWIIARIRALLAKGK